MEKKIKQMAVQIAKDEKAHISLDEALREGMVIPTQDVEREIDKALRAERDKIRAEVEEEVREEFAPGIKKIQEKQINSYLDGTGLTSMSLFAFLVSL